jgi:hypothetical protein
VRKAHRIIPSTVSDARAHLSARALGHDLRTPACSIQSASSLLAAFPAVAADAEACALLQGVDATCAVLLRCVTNVLSLRTLQRTSTLPLAPPVPTQLRACIARSVALVCGFLGDPPRVTWAEGVLPDSVLVDAPSLEACVQNVLLAAVRLGAWLPTHRPVRLRVAAQQAQLPPPAADAVELRISAQQALLAADAAELHVIAQAQQPGGSDGAQHDGVPHVAATTAAHPNNVLLLITADTPGRPLSRDEIERMMSPCGMVPADKGGGTGLALAVARGIARSLGGELEVECDREEGTHISVRIPLATAQAGVLPPPPPPAPPPAETVEDVMAMAGGDDALPCTPCTPGMDELALTTRMFTSLLTNSADVFAICRITPDDAASSSEEGGDSPLRVLVEFVSPAASRGVAFCMQLHVGQELHEVCVPEERRAFDAAVERAFRGSGTGGGGSGCPLSDAAAEAKAHLLFFVHRCVTPSGGSAWCTHPAWWMATSCCSCAATCARARAWSSRCAPSRSPQRTTCASAVTRCWWPPRCLSAAPAPPRSRHRHRRRRRHPRHCRRPRQRPPRRRVPRRWTRTSWCPASAPGAASSSASWATC